MPQSLSLVTYDLLSYHGTGNFGLFERCFNRALDSLSLDSDIEESDRRRYRNSVLRFLRCLGYIEVFNHGGKTTWCVPEPCFVQRAEQSFVLIGGTQAEWVATEKAPGLVKISRSLDELVKIDTNFLELECNPAFAQKLAEQTGFRISLNYQKTLFDLLPSLQNVYLKVLEVLDGAVILDHGHSHFYSPESKIWLPFSDGILVNQGLYKTQFFDMKTNFYLVTQDRHRSKHVYHVYSPEWALLCLLGKLKLKLKLRYDPTTKQLRIEKTGYLNFPTLVERCLRSGTMMSPKYDRQWTIYENIDVRSYWLLLSKFPIFQVES